MRFFILSLGLLCLGIYLGSKYDFKFNVSTKSQQPAASSEDLASNEQAEKVNTQTTEDLNENLNFNKGKENQPNQTTASNPEESKKVLILTLKDEQTKAAREIYKSYNREILYNLLQGALNGSPQSQYLLGCFYEGKCYIYSLIKEDGENLVIDKPLADLTNFWLEKAASKGNAAATLKIVLRNFAELDARPYDPAKLLSHIKTLEEKDLKEIPFAKEYLTSLSQILAGEVK